MSLEATVVCVDNSEWTRNGDYAPNRFQAQADAVNLLAGAKTQANPENTVSVLRERVFCGITYDRHRVTNDTRSRLISVLFQEAQAILANNLRNTPM